MKKFIGIATIVTLIFIAQHNVVDATAWVQPKENLVEVLEQIQISKYEIELEMYRQFVYENVPVEYSKSFFDNTRNNYELGLVYLGIAMKESEGFLHRVSIKPNKDGSIDLGPMQLNSNNLKNEKFMMAFAPEECIENIDVYYMIICINYFNSLLKDWEGNLYKALQNYNGGRKAVQNNTRITQKYAECVIGHYKGFKDKWKQFTENTDNYKRASVNLILQYKNFKYGDEDNYICLSKDDQIQFDNHIYEIIKINEVSMVY
jgi:hypothetical protein